MIPAWIELKTREKRERIKGMENEEFISRLKECKKEMFLLAFSIVKNYHDAEDVVAETMLKAYEKIHTLKDEKSFKFWIMQILVNNARMILRKNKKVVCVDEIDIYIKDNSECITDIWESVLVLEDELRTIVVMYYYQGFKTNEIASILKLPDGTIKSRLSRARKKLKLLID